jgi:AcrR family transcriptional regulator
MTNTTARGRATRLRLVEAAAHLMHVNGVAATSVDDVLEAAGAGKSQFYHAFESKDALVAAVLEFQAASGEEEQAALFRAHPGWEGIRAWFDAIVASQTRARYAGGCPVGSMAAEMADRDPVLRRRLKSAFQRKRNAVHRHLAALQATGGLRAEADADALANFVMAALQGGLLLGSTYRNGTPLAHAVEAAWAHLRSFRS